MDDFEKEFLEKYDNKETLSDEYLEEICDIGETISDEIIDQTRWDTYFKRIFKIGDRYFRIDYSRGSTEIQDGQFSVEEPYEVYPTKVEITDYLTKSEIEKNKQDKKENKKMEKLYYEYMEYQTFIDEITRRIEDARTSLSIAIGSEEFDKACGLKARIETLKEIVMYADIIKKDEETDLVPETLEKMKKLNRQKYQAIVDYIVENEISSPKLHCPEIPAVHFKMNVDDEAIEMLQDMEKQNEEHIKAKTKISSKTIENQKDEIKKAIEELEKNGKASIGKEQEIKEEPKEEVEEQDEDDFELPFDAVPSVPEEAIEETKSDELDNISEPLESIDDVNIPDPEEERKKDAPKPQIETIEKLEPKDDFADMDFDDIWDA